MADNYLGYLVSIECNNTFYQGIVNKIDLFNNTIHLSDYYRNGLKATFKDDGHNKKHVVEIKTSDIQSLQIIADSKHINDFLASKKPIQIIDDNNKQPLDQQAEVSNEFDFEKNLALFNKTESKLEFENGGAGQLSTGNGSQKNYRFDEMIIDPGEPIKLNKQIEIPCELNKNIKRYYVTDDGYQIPCIDLELRQQILAKSYIMGYSKERQIECIAKLCTEMSIQLLGGPIRFHPKNNHQKPNVCILADSCIQGAYALCTARLLSIRNCNVYLYFHIGTQSADTHHHVSTEYNLFKLSDAKQVKSIDDIESIPMDLIINGTANMIECTQTESCYSSLIKYLNKCKCNILSIDPPKHGSLVKSKWSIVPLLPLEMSEQCGRIYLCDLGFTRKLFDLFQIKYKSPFGAKFLIPLHEN